MDADQLEFLERLRRGAQGTFWDYVGAELVAITPERVIVTLQLQPHHLNQMGIVHGGVTATLLDSTMGLAAMVARPDDDVVTTNLNVHYLTPAKTGQLKITAELVHSSRKLITTQGHVYSETGELCAMATGTFRVMERRRE
ncbi:PaaI family thioesterase [Paenibacillus sp. YYML68]|uniref:PaaI family thioesterase n=1 Tax=Paenibacillus sp. YYML68 TaxID=2909250 RepID=UPI0024927746|nr:PaaI family thioesterase [Paenibacillus sp. YYML68]